ncbi:MAG: NAD-dependent deacylase [Haliscomenobacter sp.]|nr:NAD-dependent deacylase [Haliscomenobacter sp.]MBK8878419.1 NAD-dependent deacylase [Haliscomenobacter sp.]
MDRHVVVLTGAGISAESGIPTFRDSGGLWQKHDFMELASIQGWQKNPELVLEFYNDRRRQLNQVEPNPAHVALAELEKRVLVTIVTQNVDDLHERAGSKTVIHLHGELRKVRSTRDPKLVLNWADDLRLGDLCPLGSQLRPHIVWFGEEVPMIGTAAGIVSTATELMIVGTSMQVYPAASLVQFVSPEIPVYYIDPHPSVSAEFENLGQFTLYAEKASTGVAKAIERILS